MKTEYLKYKGYLGTIEPQIEDGTLFGKLAFIRDLITYESPNLIDLKREFEASVDVYLEDCAELGKDADTPCKGSFNVRITPHLHQDAVLAAGGKSLNAFVSEAIKEKIERCHTP
ncbi:MAG: type II toxin-antitoxin system HicB family antitoxin [Bermanella sp.]